MHAASHFSNRFHDEWSGALVVGRKHQCRLHGSVPFFAHERRLAKRKYAVSLAFAPSALDRRPDDRPRAKILPGDRRDAARSNTRETSDEQYRRSTFDQPSAQRHARPRCEWLRKSQVAQRNRGSLLAMSCSIERMAGFGGELCVHRSPPCLKSPS